MSHLRPHGSQGVHKRPISGLNPNPLRADTGLDFGPGSGSGADSGTGLIRNRFMSGPQARGSFSGFPRRARLSRRLSAPVPFPSFLTHRGPLSMSKSGLLVLSRRLHAIRHLASYLSAEGVPVPGSKRSSPEGLAGVVGWGHKPTADAARAYAKEHGLPYYAVEDGFYRSLDLGCRGADPLSLVVDATGIYYDATGPSDLENLLEKGGWETPELMEEARRCLGIVLRRCLSKYNHAPVATRDFWSGRELSAKAQGGTEGSGRTDGPDRAGRAGAPRVLVLDQTAGDASVSLGLAGPETFAVMLEEVLKEFPKESVRVKTHPDVLAGKKRGHLTEIAGRLGVRVVAEDCAPLSLLAQADVVCTVSSQMGFEALLLGKEVRCWGMPFYAGWGATKDRQVCARRTRTRTPLEIFAAGCLKYARYVDPVTGELCSMERVLAILSEQRLRNERNRGHHACLGFRWWKRPYAKAYLGSTGGTLSFHRSARGAVATAKERGGEVVVWSGALKETTRLLCEKNAVPLARMEDGFIRSVGLGSDFNWPYSLVVDREGIYYDPNSPSELETLLEHIRTRPDLKELTERARTLREFLLARGLTKYNDGRRDQPDPVFPEGRAVVLVPGQVEDDASVRRGGFGMDNLALLKAARESRPDAYILYKPHPDVDTGNRLGKIPEETAKQYADAVIRDFPMGRLLPLVDEVHTLTSLTGFEALLRGIRVRAYGGPFYAGWGLTEDTRDFPRRTTRLTLDELVAGVLLLYPTCYDWQTRSFCRVEDVCNRLLQPHGQMRGRIWAPLVAFARTLLRRLGH